MAMNVKTRKKLTTYCVFYQRKFFKVVFKKKELREKLNQHNEMCKTRRVRIIFLHKGELLVDAEGYFFQSRGR